MGGNPKLINCLLSGNWSGTNGGGLWIDGSDVGLQGCEFRGNEGSEAAGGRVRPCCSLRECRQPIRTCWKLWSARSSQSAPSGRSSCAFATKRLEAKPPILMTRRPPRADPGRQRTLPLLRDCHQRGRRDLVAQGPQEGDGRAVPARALRSTVVTTEKRNINKS